MKKSNISTTNPELARAMTYDVFSDANFKTQSEYLSFGAFFLRDLDGDGYADKIAGTCKEINATDTLYISLDLTTEGELQNGIITINGENFNLKTTIVKDSVVKSNAISSDTTSIELNTVSAGTNKTLMGTILADINSAEDYTRINSITLTGTYVDSEGNETPIEKTINLTVDWYGYVTTEITSVEQTVYASDIINDLKQQIDVSFTITVEETEKELILTENYVTGSIPALNDCLATSVVLEGSNGELIYDADTGEFTIIRTGDDLPSVNSYILTITYPLEAYEASEEDTVAIQIPVQAYYVAQNNANEEFENPITSNIASKAITVIIEEEKVEQSKETQVKVTVGKNEGSQNKKVVSKKLALQRYAGEEITENTEYIVQWRLDTGTETSGSIVIEQTKADDFENASSALETMEDYSYYAGIYIVGAESVLGASGYIEVINADTNDVLHTFTTDDWNAYTSTAPFYYSENIKNIKIETSNVNSGTTLLIYNVKELDDELIVSSYDNTDFDNLEKIYSYVTATESDNLATVSDSNYAYYENQKSIVKISIENDKLSTQDTEENAIITITPQSSGYNIAYWTDAQYIVKFPAEISNVSVNSITSDNLAVQVIGYETYKQDGAYLIKIVTSNDVEVSYNLQIDCDLVVDPRIATTTGSIEVYGANENCENYLSSASSSDIYDVNSNADLTEIVAYNQTTIEMIAPETLTTAQLASEYDDNGTVTLAPEVVEIVPGDEDKTAKITIQILNNYSGNISETLILGKIPFTGNTDLSTGTDLGSTYVTHISESGVAIPNKLEGQVTVYYSTNEEPNNDLTDESNGWDASPSDWSQIKTYLIDFGDYVLEAGEECEFSYEIVIPYGISFNKISYSTHKISFCLETGTGKLKQEVQPAKLGFIIAKRYTLEITKYRRQSENTVQGVTFKITEIDDDGNEQSSKVRTTDSSGIATVDGLYTAKRYIIKEIKTTKEYELNTEEVEFITNVNESTGELEIEIISGSFLNDEVTITQATTSGSVPVVSAAYDDEVKYNLQINATDSSSYEKMSATRFSLTGGTANRVLITNSKGQVSLSSLTLDTEYTLTETKADGYYLLENPITFMLTRNATGDIEAQVICTSETTYSLKEVSGTVCPTLVLNIANDKIPTYNLELIKISTETELTTNGDGAVTTTEGLQGAQFQVYSEDTKTTTIYTTDEYGYITLEGLYEYVEGKSITGQYKITEIYAPAGYATGSETLVFKAQRNDAEDITIKILSGEDFLADAEDISGLVYSEDGTEITTRYVTVDDAASSNPTIQFVVEDESIFSLVKVDSDTNGTLEGAKFAIYQIDETGEITSVAYDIDGSIVGNLETIGDTEYYVVTTAENGSITLNLGEGLYKAVEVEAPTGYILEWDESDRTYYFGIGQSVPASATIDLNWEEENFAGQEVFFEDIEYTSDGGKIVGGYFTGQLVIDAAKTTSNEAITLEDPTSNTYDGLIIKYDSNRLIEWANQTYGTIYNYIRRVEVVDDGYIALVEGKTMKIPASATETGSALTITCNDYDIAVIKYNSTGQIVWGNNIQSKMGQYPFDIESCSDGGFVTIGYTRSSGTETIAASKTALGAEITMTKDSTTSYSGSLLTKYNSEGLIEWVKVYSVDAKHVYGYAVSTNSDTGEITALYNVTGTFVIDAAETVDGEEITVGVDSTTAQLIMIRYNEDGLVELVKNYGITSTTPPSIQTTSDGGNIFINKSNAKTISAEDTVAGADITLSTGISLHKINSEGLVEWATSIKNSSLIPDKVIVTSDGGCAYAGYITGALTIPAESTASNVAITLTNSGSTDGIIIKFDQNGLVEWANNLGSISADTFNGITQADDAIIVAGNFKAVESTTGVTGAVIVAYDLDGTIIESDYLATATSSYKAVVVTDDGGSLAVGYFSGVLNIEADATSLGTEINLVSNGQQDCLIVKYDSNGLVEWARSFGGYVDDQILTVTKINGGYIMGGYSNSSFTISGDITSDGANIEVSHCTTSNTTNDALVVRCDEQGNIEQARVIAGSNSTYTDQITASVATNDGGYLLAGKLSGTITIAADETTNETAISKTLGTGYVTLIKYDYDNKIEWIEDLVASSQANTKVYDIDCLTEGDYVLACETYTTSSNTATIDGTKTSSGDTITFSGNTYGDGVLIRYSSTDFKVDYCKWFQPTSGASLDYCSSVSNTSDGGYIAIWAGYTASGLTIPAEDTVDGEDIVFKTGWSSIAIKYNKENKVEWAQSFDRDATQIAQTSDGCYIISNQSTTNGQTRQIRKYDSKMSTLLWQVKTSVNKFAVSGTTIVTAGDGPKNNAASAAVAQYTETIISAEVPEALNITATNTKITYTITGTVNGSGGSISIGGGTKEIVRYNENSTYDIIITPDSGYIVKTITVNDETISFTADIDGSVTLEKFSNVTSNKNIVVTFLAETSAYNVIVHHYLWEDGATTKNILADEYIIGEAGQPYTTEPNIDLESYELITNNDFYGDGDDEYYIPSNSSGTIADTDIEVIYYYKAKTYTLTIHHYLDGTKTSLIEDTIVQNITYGTTYELAIEKDTDLKYLLSLTLDSKSSEQLDIDRQRYKISIIVGGESGEITSDTEVIVYYMDTAFDLTAKIVWEDNDNSEILRPATLEIYLIKNTEQIATYELDIANNELEYVFQGLYKYDENDEVIEYEVQQAEIPEGYYIKSVAQSNNTYTITNAIYGSITVKNIDKSTKTALTGATFIIETLVEDEWVNYANVTIDETEEVTLANLEQGTYRITQTKAVDGYNLNTASEEITIDGTEFNYIVTIASKAKSILPSAGGLGIYIILILGIAVMITGKFITKNGGKGKHAKV